MALAVNRILYELFRRSMKAKLLFSDMNLKRRQPFIINIGFVIATISDFQLRAHSMHPPELGDDL